MTTKARPTETPAERAAAKLAADREVNGAAFCALVAELTSAAAAAGVAYEPPSSFERTHAHLDSYAGGDLGGSAVYVDFRFPRPSMGRFDSGTKQHRMVVRLSGSSGSDKGLPRSAAGSYNTAKAVAHLLAEVRAARSAAVHRARLQAAHDVAREARARLAGEFKDLADHVCVVEGKLRIEFTGVSEDFARAVLAAARTTRGAR